MARRCVSSILTFYFKFVFTALWTVGGGCATLALFGGYLEHGADPIPAWVPWLVLGVWIFGCIVAFSHSAGLKKVSIGDGVLYISNFLQEIRVPFVAIQDVTENRLLNAHPVTIHLRVESRFGRKIVFIPTTRFFPWSSHPIVAELRTLGRLPPST